MRKKGEIVWLSVGKALEQIGASADGVELAAVEVGIRHVGPVHAQWAFRMLRRVRRDELIRIKRERAELGPDLAPELYGFDTLREGEVKTPEGEEQLAETIREIFSHEHRGEPPMLAGVRGLGEADGAERADQIAELERLALLEIFIGPALEVQAPAVTFPASSPGAGVARSTQGPEDPPDVGG